MIDWDQVEEMQKEGVDDLAEVMQTLRDRAHNPLTEDEARHASLRAQLGLNLLQFQRPSAGWPDGLSFADPNLPPAQEVPTT